MNPTAQSQSDPLPIAGGPQRKPLRNYWVHAIRLILFLAILLLIRLEHQRQLKRARAQSEAPQLNLKEIQELYPVATRLSDWSAEGVARVLDDGHQALATLVHTEQESRGIVGYVGPTTLLVFFTPEGKIRSVQIHESLDTKEHVDEIVNDGSFLDSWRGLTWQEVATQQDIDVVSGSTLTSFAIIQAIRARFGNNSPSLKFSNSVKLSEIQEVFAEASEFDESEQNPIWMKVTNIRQDTIGYFIRSSPVAESINGYQGPTDFLTFFDASGKFLRMVIRSSYDNMAPEPYVDYVREEDYFLIEQFAGLSRKEISKLDQFDVEGASGATMTSAGMFRALQHVCTESEKRFVESESATRIRLTARDLGVLLVMLLAVLATFSKLKSHQWFKVLFQIALIIYLGFLNGDILSQTLLIGWVQNGIPWQNAVGLTVLSLGAFVIPIVSKRNIYCHSICPFGAAQFLTARVSRQKVKLPNRLNKLLRKLPAVLICVIVLACLLDWGINLAALEPFDAFHFRIAGIATLVIAVLGLTFSFFVPMAYCKYGCPTGAILEFTRRTGRSGLWGKRDWLSLGILGAAYSLWLAGH